MRLALIAIVLTGCSTLEMVQPNPPPLTVTITWVRVPAPMLCRGLKSDACATPMGPTCFVAMPGDASPYVKAEELDHCFGAQHREFLP